MLEDRSYSPKVSDQQPRSPQATFTPQTTTQAKSWRSDAPNPPWMGASHGWVPIDTHSIPVPFSEGRLWVARHSNTACHKMSPNSGRSMKYIPLNCRALSTLGFLKCPFLLFLSGFPNLGQYLRPYMIWSCSSLNFCQSPQGHIYIP